MTIWQDAGVLALGSRLRNLTSLFVNDAAEIYKLYGVEADTRWFPVIFSLWKKGPMSITDLAHYCGHSHPSISKIVKDMQKGGLLKTKKSSRDGRVNLVDLSPKGEALLPGLGTQCEDVEAAAEELLDESTSNLWEAINEIEMLLQRKSLLERVSEKFRERCRREVQIVGFEEKYEDDFKRLNYEWIERFFTVEEADRAVLEKSGEIIENGGHILMAVYKGEAIGTCAIVKTSEDEFELAKMAVTDRFKGIGIGEKLGVEAIEKARIHGAKRILLESNTKLVAALGLYRKMGFRKTEFKKSDYSRCNIQMELML